jgi:hypothetical protein
VPGAPWSGLAPPGWIERKVLELAAESILTCEKIEIAVEPEHAQDPLKRAETHRGFALFDTMEGIA